MNTTALHRLTDLIGATRAHVRTRAESATLTIVTRLLDRHRRHIAATNDLDRLTVLALLADHLDDTLERSVIACLAAGHPWHDVGARIGPTRLAEYPRLFPPSRTPS